MRLLGMLLIAILGAAGAVACGVLAVRSTRQTGPMPYPFVPLAIDASEFRASASASARDPVPE